MKLAFCLRTIRKILVNLDYDEVWNNQHSYAGKKAFDMIRTEE